MRRLNNAGFALLEVLIATSIVSVAGLYLAQSLRQSRSALRTADEKYEASLAASNLLWMMDRSPDNLGASDALGEGTLENLHWTVSAGSLENADLKDRLDSKVITMTWTSSGPGSGAFGLSGYYNHEDAQH